MQTLQEMTQAALILLAAGSVFAQTGALTFEAASIKPSDRVGGVVGITTLRGRIVAENVTLKRCIRGAYDVQEPQILGGPKWVDEDRYFIEAKAARPVGGHDLMLMLQALLAERFKLVVHRETRALAGYALVAAKSGLKAKPSAPGTDSSGSLRRGGLDARGYTMAQLAVKLSETLHLPVADRTGIAGKYDFKLEWTTADEMRARADAADGPSIFSALQEQVGLRLQSRKVAAEVLVIDHAEKPGEN